MTVEARSPRGPALRRRGEIVLVVVLLGVMLALLVISARSKSATYDEWSYIAGGLYFLETGDNAIHRDAPAGVKAWIAWPVRILIDPSLPRTRDFFPWNYGQAFLGQLDDPDRVLFVARISIMALALLLAVYVHLLARALWGRAGGLLALLILCLEPNVLAHGRLTQGDVALAAFGTGMLYFLWRAVSARSGSVYLVIAALHAVLATEAKFVGWLLVPLGVAALVVSGLLDRRRPVGRRLWFPAVVFVTTSVLASGIIVWLVYGGPQAYRLGFVSLFEHLDRGHPVFLAGEFREMGWWYYNPVAWLAKTPLPVVLGIVLALVMGRGRAVWTRLGFILVPALGWTAAAATSSVCLGVRHMLFVTALAAVAVGGLVRMHESGNRRTVALWGRRVLAGVLLVWLGIGTLRLCPDYLVHFNELAGGPAPEPPLLTDANLDWGQDLPALAAWLAARGNPEIMLIYFGTDDPTRFGIRTSPFSLARDPDSSAPGLLAVSVSYLVHAPRHPELSRMLLRCEPVTTVRGGTVKIFRFTDRTDSSAPVAPGPKRNAAPSPKPPRNGEFR